MNETIVAPSSPYGRGGISVVRMSGPLASDCGLSLCGALPASWSLRICDIRGKGGEKLDSGLVAFFQSPKSYTGEDVVEIHCHGNPLIVDSIISAAVDFGCSIAEPGEFTKRAFLNNKIDLTQAESVGDLISAQTFSALKSASASLDGGFSEHVADLIKDLTKTRVRLEASLDFPDEGVVDERKLKSSTLHDLKRTKGVLEGVISKSKSGLHLREGLKVVIAGPPNCGKSTLLNFFAEKETAIVADLPGTTRDVLRVSVDLRGVPVELVDTAGLRDNPTGEIEKEGIVRALKEIDDADLVLLMGVVGEKFSLSVGAGLLCIKVFNKVDLFQEKKAGVLRGGGVCISALKGDGVDVLVDEIYKSVGFDFNIEVPFLARRRHLDFLSKVCRCLHVSIGLINSDSGLELVAEELRKAQNFLGEITDPVSPDELLGEIFSKFCIGK